MGGRLDSEASSNRPTAGPAHRSQIIFALCSCGHAEGSRSIGSAHFGRSMKPMGDKPTTTELSSCGHVQGSWSISDRSMKPIGDKPSTTESLRCMSTTTSTIVAANGVSFYPDRIPRQFSV